MMKYTIITMFFVVYSAPAMEIELATYPKNSLSIQDTADERKLLIKKMPAGASINLSLLSLDQVGRLFARLPQSCFDKAKRQMLPNMAFMCDIAAQMPEEVKKNIIFFMLDGQSVAMEKFCKKSIGKAFQLYHEIKSGIGDDKISVGPLYAKSKADREFVLKMLNPWYYPQPIITIEEKSKIDLMDEDMKQYFIGRNIIVLPEGEENEFSKEGIGFCLLGSCTPILSGGLLMAVGTCFGENLGSFLVPLWCSACGFGACIGCWVGIFQINKTCGNSQKITL